MPALYNTAGDPENDWVDVRKPNGRAGTLDEWLEEGRGLVLYRLLTWQKETMEAMRDPSAVTDFILKKAQEQERRAQKKRGKKGVWTPTFC